VKDKIIEVALARFLQFGIRSMTINKLVEPLGISTKTVYKYFESKEELLKECISVFYTGLYNEFSAILKSNENPVVILLSVFRGTLAKDFGVNRDFFHDLNHYYPSLQNAAISRRKGKLGELIMPVMWKGVSEGYFNSDLRPDIAMAGIEVLYSSITRSDRYKQFKTSPNVLFNNLVEVFVRGMCTEKGLKEIENQYNKH
jgi:AcrR family transcriptional regulator